MQSIHPIILEILKARGVQSEADIQEFLSPKPKLTYDPFLLLNMEEGVDFILSTIRQNKRICVYGDYDADGVTATSLMLELLGNLTDNLTYHIPSRFDEGYGLNTEALDTIKKDGVSLVITVDCGSVSYEEVEYAKGIGLDVIVTDHHNINHKPADCILINPKQENCQYPYKNLSGCGVAFKVAQAIQRRTDLDKSIIHNLLDLVAIATVGDVVPLLDENRTMIKYGLEVIKSGRRKGLAALMEAVSLDKNRIKSENLAYIIVPHLNAAGRMLRAGIGVELLTGKDHKDIERCVNQLIECNKERKRIQEEILEKCLKIVEEKYQKDLFLVIDAGEAHEGITGIVAGKIKELYGKPTLILTDITGTPGEKSGLIKGTGRSIETVNLYDALFQFHNLFEKFGGHSGACGLSMKAENLKDLTNGLEDYMKEQLSLNRDLLTVPETSDGVLTLEDVSLDFMTILETLEPFGHENTKPKFHFSSSVLKSYSFMGDSGKHVRFVLSDGKGQSLPCVLFNKAKEYDPARLQGKAISVLGYPELNVWNGKSNLQINVEKIKEVI